MLPLPTRRLDDDRFQTLFTSSDTISADATEISAEGARTFSLQRKDGFVIRFFTVGQSFGFTCGFRTGSDNNSITVASALIVSELVNGVWKRSTSNLRVGNGAANKLVKTVFSFDQWASLYAPKPVVSSKYLNNGDEKTGINN